MKHFKTHRGAFKRKLKAFGDLVKFTLHGYQKNHGSRIPYRERERERKKERKRAS